MATIVTRIGKGSPLTHLEVDNNFTNLNSSKAEISSVEYGRTGTLYEIFAVEAPNSIAHSDSSYKTMFTWVASRSGSVKVNVTAYITSGTHYFAYRILRNGTDTLASGSYNTNLDTGQSASVHEYRRFALDVDGINAGDSLVFQMVSANSSGTPVTGVGQTLYAKELRVFSNKPSYERGALQTIGLPTGKSDIGTEWDSFELVQPVVFAGFDYKLLGDFELREAARYLDIKTNIASNNLMLQFFVHGYLYGRGNIFAIRGGYTYEPNAMLNEAGSTLTGTNQIASLYRAADGAVCVKIDKLNTDYTEGRVSVYFHAHNKSVQSAAIALRYKQNNTAGAVF